MSRLTRDEMAEPVSRDQILRRERDQIVEILFYPVQLTTSRIGILTRSIHTKYFAIYDDHTCIGSTHTIVQSFLLKKGTVVANSQNQQ